MVDARIIQRLDYPEFIIEVDRAKAADLGLNQAEVMKNVVAALNSSIQYHKKNFWIDPVSKNQYFVGVQYFEEDIDSVETLLDVPITSPKQSRADPAAEHRLAPPRHGADGDHAQQPPVDDRPDDGRLRPRPRARRRRRHAGRRRVRRRPGRTARGSPTTRPTVPPSRKPLKGAMIELSGEYSRMQETFRSLGFGLILATMLIYFLMAALFKSYLTPLVILFAVPLGLIGVVIMLYLTGTAINVQSLLGVIFMVGIVVSNTVLLVDFAQNLRVAGGPDARPGDPQGGVDPGPPGGDDGPGGLLRADPDVAGPGPRQRGQRPARPGGHRRHPGGAGHDPVRRALALFPRGQGQLG